MSLRNFENLNFKELCKTNIKFSVVYCTQLCIVRKTANVFSKTNPNKRKHEATYQSLGCISHGAATKQSFPLD